MVESLWDGDPEWVGSYELVGRLAVGGMGEVFLGRSQGGRLVAVKTVRSELAADSEFRRRFADEVVAARKVGGFYTAQLVDADPDGTPPWLATAYTPGLSLQQAVTAHSPLPPGSVAMLGAGLAEGLAAVHAQDLVHRDLKPGNVILAEDGPRLIDFGIARALDVTSYTRTHTVLGTAAFMSPEQVMGDRVGPASDVFSLGCVLGFAVAGQSPFGSGPPPAIGFRVVHNEPDLTGIGGGLASIIGSCLAKTSDERPAVQTLLIELGALARELPLDSQQPGAQQSGGQIPWLPRDLTETIARRTTEVRRDPWMSVTRPMNHSGRTRVDESAADQKDGERARQPDDARDADSSGKDADENRPQEAKFQLIPSGKRNMDRVKEIGNAIIAPYYFYLVYVLLAAVGGWISGAQFTAEEVFTVYTDWMTTEQALGVAAVFSFLLVVLSFMDQEVYGRLKLSADGITAFDDRVSPFPLPDRTVWFEWKDVRHIRMVREGSERANLVVQLNEKGEAMARKRKLRKYNDDSYVLVTLDPKSTSERSAVIDAIRDALPRSAGDRAERPIRRS